METRLITSAPELESACARWRGARVLALDTEFERSRTYYPRAALVQVAQGGTSYLIDPIALQDLAPLFEVLAERRITKVLHSASEDMEIFYRTAGALPRGVFDTQVAAALTGHGYALSYRRLVAALLGVDLPKDATRSDWLRRPLSATQISYAALDVAYLGPLHERLSRELQQSGREAWAQEEFERLQDETRFDPDPDAVYLRVRGARQLSRRELGVLQRLCAWREREARHRDVPRGFVVRDPVLIGLARHPPHTRADLLTAGLHPRETGRSGEMLLDLVRTALATPENALPAPGPAPLDVRRYGKMLQRLKHTVQARAEILGVPAPMLASRDSLEALVRAWHVEGTKALPRELEGWRRAVITGALVAELERVGFQ